MLSGKWRPFCPGGDELRDRRHFWNTPLDAVTHWGLNKMANTMMRFSVEILWKNISNLIWILLKVFLKGAVSYRFSQGLLTLMCNNSELKADINFFFFLLRRQTS